MFCPQHENWKHIPEGLEVLLVPEALGSMCEVWDRMGHLVEHQSQSIREVIENYIWKRWKWENVK